MLNFIIICFSFLKETLQSSGICVKGKLLPDPGSEAVTHVLNTITSDSPTSKVQVQWYVSQNAAQHIYQTKIIM